MAEALLEHADAEPGDAAADRVREPAGHLVVERRRLPWVEPVGPGEHVEEQGRVGDRARHRAEVVERHLERECARVRDEPVRRLQPDDPRPRARAADRAALVTADREIDLPVGEERAAAARRAAARTAEIVRVEHRSRVARVTRAGVAERLADGLAGDRRAGRQHAGDDGRVLLGHVAVEHRAAVHQRHAADRDVVLHRHGPPGQRAARRAVDLGLPVPAAEPVLAVVRPVPAVTAGGSRRRAVLRAVEPVVRPERLVDERRELVRLALGQRESEATRQPGNVGGARPVDRHGSAGLRPGHRPTSCTAGRSNGGRACQSVSPW